MARSAKIYQGWSVVAALFIAGMMVYGAGLYGFTLLVPPLSEEFGWSRAATGGLVSVFWLAAPLAPLGGMAISRLGASWVACSGIVLASVCLALVAFTDSLVVMYALRALMGVGKIMMMAGVTALASLWFRRRFGLAIAVCFAGWHFGGLTIAPFAQYLIEAFGWRTACLILAVSITVVALPPMLLFGRRQPGPELALELDGGTVGSDPHPVVGRAMTSWPFWAIVMMTVFASFTYGSLLTHEVALLEGVGISAMVTATALSVTAGMALLGALAIGYLSDRLGYFVVMTIELVLMAVGAVGFLLLLTYPSLTLLFVAAASFGIAVGGFDTCIVARIQNAFGAPNFNHLFGLWYLFYLATLFGGPIAAGWLFDVSGSYRTGLYAMLAGLAASAILLVLQRAPALPVGGRLQNR